MVRPLTTPEAKVCASLYRQKCFGAGHRLVDTVVSGFPPRLRGDAKDAIEELLRDGILQRKSSKNGLAIFIPAKLAQAVRERVIEHPEWAWLPK